MGLTCLTLLLLIFKECKYFSLKKCVKEVWCRNMVALVRENNQRQSRSIWSIILSDNISKAKLEIAYLIFYLVMNTFHIKMLINTKKVTWLISQCGSQPVCCDPFKSWMTLLQVNWKTQMATLWFIIVSKLQLWSSKEIIVWLGVTTT